MELHTYIPWRSFAEFHGEDAIKTLILRAHPISQCYSGLFLFRRVYKYPYHAHTPSPLPHTSLHTHVSIGSLSSISSLPDQFGQLSVGRGCGRGGALPMVLCDSPRLLGGYNRVQWAESRRRRKLNGHLFCFVLQCVLYQLSTFSSAWSVAT